MELFAEEDRNSKGRVNRLVFSYVMSNRLGLEHEEMEVLMDSLADGEGDIDYQKLATLIKDREYLEAPMSTTSQLRPPEPVEPRKKYLW